MKIRQRLVYAEGDAAATLLRPRRLRYDFAALLCPFYIKYVVQLICVQLMSTIDVLNSLCFITTDLLCWMIGGPGKTELVDQKVLSPRRCRYVNFEQVKTIATRIPIRFYYDLHVGASTTFLLRSCSFCNDSSHFDKNFES